MEVSLISVIIAFGISVIIAGIVIPHVLRISIKKKLFDSVDERKIHKGAIPRLGGVAFLPTTFFSFFAVLGLWGLLGVGEMRTFSGLYSSQFYFYVCGMTMLYLVGIADDLIGVRYRNKLVVQVLAALLLTASGLWFNNLYGLLGIHHIPAIIGVPFTVLTVVFVTNAINLIDGIDGLASGLSLVSLIFFTVLFAFNNEWIFAILTAANIGVLVPFFYYNVFGKAENATKIFMGDTGSLTMGFTLSFLAIAYCRDMALINPLVPVSNKFVVSFCTLIVPCFDVFRVVLVRMRNKKSPFMPDKNHIHHKMMAMGLTPRKALISLLALSMGFSVFNLVALFYMDANILLFIDIAIWVGLNLWWDRIRDQQ